MLLLVAFLPEREREKPYPLLIERERREGEDLKEATMAVRRVKFKFVLAAEGRGDGRSGLDRTLLSIVQLPLFLYLLYPFLGL
jgi:hypothetical protein